MRLVLEYGLPVIVIRIFPDTKTTGDFKGSSFIPCLCLKPIFLMNDQMPLTKYDSWDSAGR
jgi:hypothetical protein